MSANVKEIKDADFAAVVKTGVVLVDFWAPWCGPCQMQGPIIDDMADELTDVKVCKVNVDENPDLAKKYRVMSIPNLVVIENGALKAQEVGVHDRAGILDMLGK